MKNTKPSLIRIDKNLTFTSTDKLMDVFKKIDKNGLGVCFYISDTRKLLGVLTDGDIRRSLIENNNLDMLACQAVTINYEYGYINQTIETWAKKLTKKIRILPLVDEKFRLVDCFSLDKVTQVPISSPQLGSQEISYLANAISSGWISSSGHYIHSFETEFSKFCQTKFATTTSNGTAALHLALMSLDIGVGDEVIVPDLTFAATINSVLHTGATPVIVDIERDSWCISPASIAKAITNKTKAIIVVHLCGQVADMDLIMSLAKEHGVYVIEDCAEAHGAKYNQAPVGSIGDIGCFSFFANKIITTGEGGMCVTSHQWVHDRMKIIKNHGMSPTRKYWHITIGYNYRMTNLQAAVGLAQLERIEDFLKIRKQYENMYKKLFSDNNLDFEFPSDLKNRSRVIWLVTALLKDANKKEDLIEFLTRNNIDVRSFFYPISEMEIYKKYKAFESSNSKKISTMGIFLPTFNSSKNLKKIEKLKLFKSIEN
ncbi:aminotransferase class I/II-fold pyridoxal phosphate-dependent enzyme [Alphaproteobacteria bacterium]|nr:aminotransferase class I/II-fold pyridoxal phosphate-dependent enzyme [Alphaproteobacteria bacterium]